MGEWTKWFEAAEGQAVMEAIADHIRANAKAAKQPDEQDGRLVRLVIDKVVAGHIHEIHLDGLKSAKGAPLLHPEFYYTLNYIPKA